MYTIYPDVKFQKNLPGFFSLKNEIALFCEEDKKVVRDLISEYKCRMVNLAAAQIKYLKRNDLTLEAYEIDINPQEILIYAGYENGFYYATKTLKQLLPLKEIPCGIIKDAPDLKIRGFMYDISRNKVPKVETVKRIIDIMSDLKMNHLELYIEGFSFEYQSFPQYLEKEAYLKVVEYKELEAYANERYIDLVPNENGFGHMTAWLQKAEFAALAESPDGIYLWGTHRLPSTLNPLDAGSLKLVEKLYGDLLSLSKSQYFHMNFDEPLELGKGQTKAACLKEGLENVYFDFVLKAYDIVKKYNKIPLIWADVMIHNDAVLQRAPKDMIFVDWGYEAEHPFDVTLQKLKAAGVKFMAAPGTSSWCSLLTRTPNYMENIASAVWHTFMLQGEGILLTDWGDMGHLQPLSVSFAPLVYAGLLSYRVRHGTFKQVSPFLNKFVFHDRMHLAGFIYTGLGTYHQYEPQFGANSTLTFATLRWIVDADHEKEDAVSYFKEHARGKTFDMPRFLGLRDFFFLKAKAIDFSLMPALCKQELKNAIDILTVLSKVNISYNDEVDLDLRLQLLSEADNAIDEVITEFRRLWLERNKVSHLEDSAQKLTLVKEFIKKSIASQGRTP